ncbi:methyltransferase domain-containing protein [[Eubacterium] cellulosolvens]
MRLVRIVLRSIRKKGFLKTSIALVRYISAYIKSINTKPKIEISKEKWLKAQEIEFRHHKHNAPRRSEEFIARSKNTSKLWNRFGFSSNQFSGKIVIDVGSGPVLRTSFFKNTKIIAIEPLADRFLKELEWCDLSSAEIYKYPAEKYLPELEGIGDFATSINVLNHCYNFEKVIENISRYLKPEGLAFLSFGSRKVTDELHLLIITEEVCQGIFLKKGLKIEGMSRTKTSPEHRGYKLSYWLRRS